VHGHLQQPLPQEIDGLLTYDRRWKFNPDDIRSAVYGPPSRPSRRRLIQSSTRLSYAKRDLETLGLEADIAAAPGRFRCLSEVLRIN